MRVGVLVTNNGPHSAAKWAEQTASQIVDIIQIEPNSLAFDELTAQKSAFETELAKHLTDHHETVQDYEKAQIAAHGMDRLDTPMEPEAEHLDQATKFVCDHATTKLFGSHFRRPEVIEHVRQVIGSHFASSKQIERSWHADSDPSHPAAVAFKAKYHPGNK